MANSTASAGPRQGADSVVPSPIDDDKVGSFFAILQSSYKLTKYQNVINLLPLAYRSDYTPERKMSRSRGGDGKQIGVRTS